VKAQVMGVLNVTPDSFSDGGRWFEHDAAILHGLELLAEGADVIDVGGESTRPGAEPVDPVEEQRRVLPVIAALASYGRISVDTRNESTARAAVEAGASLINDISAALSPVAATTGAGWVAMHMQGDPRTMQEAPRYDDVVAEVTEHLVRRAEAAVAAGVDEVWIDPGFGFGKTLQHNRHLLAHLDQLVATGFPVLVGASRKGFLGMLLAASDERASLPTLADRTRSAATGAGAFGGLEGSALEHRAAVDARSPVAVDDRIEGSITVATWAALQGAGMVRVHDVAATVDAITLVGGTA
jgi:dihydropteroate synthase